MIYTFKNFTINTDNFQLLKNDESLSIEPQVFNIILYLVENQDRVISRNELLEAIWKDKIVSDSSISNYIKSARKVLDDDGQKQAVIKTIHGRGYQFIAEYDSRDKTDSSQKTYSKSKFESTLKRLFLLGVVLVSSYVIWDLFQNKMEQTENITLESEDKSIAVLAFDDLSPESDQAYFSEGISEELLNLFTKIPDLRVASRTSSFSFKNKDVTLEQIGKELNVSYIMEGSVRKSAKKIRVTAQLIRVNDGSHVWSQNYDYQLQDIFKIQDEISQAVSEQLELTLSNDMKRSQSVNPDVQSLYLRALYFYRENTADSLKQALKIIDEALSIDSNYAPTWTLKSRIYHKIAIYSYDKDDTEYLKLAKQAIVNAKNIDNSYAMANAQMALINLIEWDFETARFNIDLAMSSKNLNSATIDIIANYFLLTGQIEKSVDMLYDDMDNNPINDTHHLYLSAAYLFFNQLKDFKNRLNKYVFFHPEGQGIYELYFYYLVVKEEYQSALEEAELNNNKFWKLNILEFVNFAQGKREYADELLKEIITDYSFAPMHIALHYALRKDANNAFKWLETARQNQDIELLYLINHHAFRNIWNHPQWSIFIGKLKLPKEHWLLDIELIEATSASTND
ncbi:Adenylate cyclase [hydrothermal vent metagenome]|uniref:Adenylate cyclase n=1 Tax=hydrothermal vent metagenome TaxID=652676 RepID=A0A3B0VMX0_9ZZZZ